MKLDPWSCFAGALLPGLMVLSIWLVSCKGSPKTNSSPSPKVDMLVGTWESLSLTIRINSAYGIADSQMLIEAREDNWVEVMGILPVQTTFNRDYTYSAVYLEVDSSLRSRSSGYFEFIGLDTLVIHKMKPNVETIRHAWVQKNDSVYGFSGLVDFDQDGVVDDELFALNKRIYR